MIVLLVQLLLTALATTLYVLFGNPPGGIAGAFAIAGVILVALIVSLILLLGFLILVLVGFRDADPKAMIKHRLLIGFAKYYYLLIMRVRLVVTGRENLPVDNNFVMYSNHIEAHDPMYIKMLYTHAPLSFISKEVLFQQFLVKDFLRSIGAIPISPGADRSALNSILEAIKRVKDGQPMGIFPEGRRTYSHDIITYKPGSFKVATKAGADISPVCVYGMHEVNRKGRILPCTVRIHVFPLIRQGDYEGMDTVELALKVENMVREKLADWKHRYPTPLETASR